MPDNVGTIDIGAQNRAKVKDIWDNGIKKYPEIRPLGLELIKFIKRKAMKMPDATDEKLEKAQRAYDLMLNALKEADDGTD